MSAPRLIRSEEQIGGKTLTLGGSASFEGNAPGMIYLNPSVPGANDAALNISGNVVVNGISINKSSVFTQLSALSLWTINHNMGKRPSVMIVTSAGDEVFGNVHYVDDNNITISFAAAFSGAAYLN